ncbi:MAG TPA: hypothetical protein VD995_16170 [Azospirillum sp.]|nr:hypothetical protein [Azospirillum sp.]
MSTSVSPELDRASSEGKPGASAVDKELTGPSRNDRTGGRGPVAAPPPRARGNGFALFVSLVALTGSAFAVATPALRPILQEKFGHIPSVAPAIDLVTADGRLEALSQRIAALDGQNRSTAGRVDAIEAVGGNFNVSARRIDQLESGFAQINARLAASEERGDRTAGRMDGIEGRFNTIERRFGEIDAAVGAAPERLKALDAGVATLAGRLDTEAGARTGLQATIEQEVVARTEIQAKLAQQDTARTDLLAKLDQEVAARAEIQAKLTAEERARTELQATLEQAQREAAALGERLQEAEKRLDEVRTSSNGAAATRLALVSQQLLVKLQTSKPYQRELDAGMKLVGEDKRLSDALSALAPFAATGVATVTELRETFVALVAPNIQAVAEATAQRSLTDRIQDWITQVVATSGLPGAVESNTTIKGLDIINRRLTEGDLAGALRQLNELGEPATRMAKRWIIEANARLAVDAAVEALLATTLDRISAT